MKKSRYSDEHIVRILRETDKDPVSKVTKRHGVNEQSIYGWRKRFSGMAVDDVREHKNLTQESASLKKLLAERDLVIEVMKEGARRMGLPLINALYLEARKLKSSLKIF